MKIPFVKFRGHPILGDLEIDFRKNCEELIIINREDDPDKTQKTIVIPTPQKGNQYSIIIDQDNIYDNILFVGENGCGKTTLLNEINNYNSTFGEKNKFIEYAFDKFNVELHAQVKGKKMFGFSGGFESHFLERDLKYNEGRLDERSKISESEVEMRDHVSGDMVSWLNIRNLSADKLENIFHNGRLAEAYTQAQKFQIPKSMRARTRDELFGKPDTMIDYIKELSSGEQEILLRILYFFKHPLSQGTDNIVIDEPETGLHPKWQLRILEYYKEIFQSQDEPGWITGEGTRLTPLSGKQKLQLFVASHSENILKSAIEQGDWLVVRLFRDSEGIIRSERIENSKRCLPAITFAETQYIVFDIPSKDYHNELYGYLQNREDKCTVKEMDEWIKKRDKYNKEKHFHRTSFTHPKSNKTTNYDTICTYIRNEIDHPPDKGITFIESQLRESIELLRGEWLPNHIK